MQTIQELQEQLKAVNDAIYAIMVGGQSYKIGSRSLTRANITELRKIRDDLEARIAANNTSPLLDDCYVAIFDGR
ncbi:MAG: peptidylprolyl isomerase [Eubacterium sp.]|nr:peptidylprolyl isomerase [Eubacterium sp.]